MKIVEEILELLRDNGKTVSTAESITAGNIQRMIASVSGASDVFKGGITAYQLSIKDSLLGIDPELAERTNCVDPDVAIQMAYGALKLFNTDYAIATCGYAEPYSKENIEIPFAYIAIGDQGIHNPVSVIKVELAGSRTEAQQQAAEKALQLFRDELREQF